ncbi:MAG TPA: PAS domain-containing protein [Gemmatimonadales bacterium]|nr:PAS domain-containing protein [Gemmatimonadales bacterium]
MKVEQAPGAVPTQVARDQTVTELRRIQQQLAEAQALAHVGSWDWDVVTDRITWSDEHYRIFGLTPRAPIDVRSVMQCIHPDDRALVERLIARSFADGRRFNCEFRVQFPDGSERIVEARAELELDHAGRLIRNHGTVQDVSERRQAETALHEAEAKYRALVEHAVEGVFRTTPAGRFLMANEALARMLGYETAEQLIADRTDLDRQHYVRPEERVRFRRLLEAEGIVRGFEYEAYRRDGTIVWLRDHVRAVRDASGATLCYEGTTEDVTSRRHAGQLLDLRVRQQAAVARFGEAAAAGGDLNALLECAAGLVAETLRVEFAQVLELRPDRTLLLRAGTGWQPDFGPVVFAAGHGSQAGFTLLSARPVVVEDARTETRFKAPRHLSDHGVISGITVLIGVPERPFGVLGAQSTAARAFTSDDVNFLQAVASLLAAAIGRQRAEDVREHLLARAISAQEEERQRVARELHDETGQALTAILVGLRNVEAAASGTAAQQIEELRCLVAATLRDVGRIARGLRPSALDDLGLIPALQRYGEELGAARALAVEISGDAGERFPRAVETTLYRIIQEALTNVASHAQARRAHVAIRRHAGGVQALVRDDGSGFDVDASLQGTARRQPLGVIGMQERASLLGGTVVIDSRLGAGTTVTVTLPVQ